MPKALIEVAIRPAIADDIPAIVAVIRAAFAPVAEQFAVTRENCPRNPSFIEPDWLSWEFDHGAAYFLAESAGRTPVGCASLMPGDDGTAELRRLAVAPSGQRSGVGGRLVEAVESLARIRGVKLLRLHMIADHAELHDWYLRRGYGDGELSHPPQVPFAVRAMTKAILTGPGL